MMMIIIIIIIISNKILTRSFTLSLALEMMDLKTEEKKIYVWMSEFLLNVSVQYNKSVGKSIIKSAGKVIISLVCQFSHEIWMLYCTEKRNIQSNISST